MRAVDSTAPATISAAPPRQARCRCRRAPVAGRRVVHHLAEHDHERDHADPAACPAAAACEAPRSPRPATQASPRQHHEQQVEELEDGEPGDVTYQSRNRLTISSIAPIAATSGPIGTWVSLRVLIAPRSSRACRAPPQSSRSRLRPNAPPACPIRAPAPRARPATPSAGAGSRSISLPFTCTTSWISSRSSSAGSASGQGSSHTRRPVIISNTSEPRCGANGKISDPAVAIAKRTSPGGTDRACDRSRSSAPSRRRSRC